MAVENWGVIVAAKSSEIANYLMNNFVFMNIFPVGDDIQELKIEIIDGWFKIFLFNLWPFSTAVYQHG